MQNHSLISAYGPAIQLLNRFVTQFAIAQQLNDAAKKALTELEGREIYSVFDFPLRTFKFKAPPVIGSIRIAAFRPNCEMEEERHANSTQFLYSLSGEGETRVMRDDLWKSDRYGNQVTGALEERWHVTPQGVWHQSVGRGDQPWVMAAIHTARKVEDEFRPAGTSGAPVLSV